MSNELFNKARNHVVAIVETLRPKSIDDLRALVHKPLQEKISIDGVAVEFTTWAREHGLTRIAAIAEARRTRLFGLWSQVTAEGFYKDSTGTITNFAEKDYWEHGY